MSRRSKFTYDTYDEQDYPNEKYGTSSRIKNYSKNFIPKTENQKKMAKSIEDNIVTFGFGSSGTGKTHIATALGLKMLLDDKINKLILIRENIPAGVEIGFLPGNIYEKSHPYIEHIHNICNDILPDYLVKQLIEEEKIEIKPLAFLRGANFKKSFIIVDESQNITYNLFKLLLTRLCEGSKLIFVGDTKQVDLKNHNNSGLDAIIADVKHLNDVGVIEFSLDDCVRIPLVKEFLKIFENKEIK